MATGIQPVHVLLGAGALLGLVLVSSAWAAPIGPPPQKPQHDPVTEQVRAAIAAAEAQAANQSPAIRFQIASQLANASGVLTQGNPALSAEIADAANRICDAACRLAGMNPDPGPNPDTRPITPPGFLAGRGNQVEVPPNTDVIGAANLPQLQPGTQATGLLVDIREADNVNLQGDVVGVLTNLGGLSGFPPVPTAPFPRERVRRITR